MNAATTIVLTFERQEGWEMGTYRIYRLDGAGRIRGAEWLDALDDRFAIEGARVLAQCDGYAGGCEVWQRDRQVGRLPPDR